MRKRKWLFGIVACFTMMISVSSISAADRKVEVSIPVENQVLGDPSQDEEFTFLLEPKDGACMPKEDRVTISGIGKTTFLPIVYTQPGTYRYTLKEIKGQQSKYAYDETAYDVMVYVSIDDFGSLSASLSVSKYGSDAKSNQALFVNSYKELPSKVEVSHTDTSTRFMIIFWVGASLLSLAMLVCLIRSKS